MNMVWPGFTSGFPSSNLAMVLFRKATMTGMPLENDKMMLRVLENQPISFQVASDQVSEIAMNVVAHVDRYIMPHRRKASFQ